MSSSQAGGGGGGGGNAGGGGGGEQRKAVIKNADMEEKMQQDAVDIASKALSEYNIEKVRCC